MSDTDTTKLKDFLGTDTPAPLPSRARPLEEETVDDGLYDPHRLGKPNAPPDDAREFLSSMGVEMTPAPAPGRHGLAERARETVEKNWIPAILMTLMITVIFFYIIGIFKLPG